MRGVGAAVAGSVGDALGSATDALRAAGCESPRLDAELLLAEATGLGRAGLAADPGRGVEAAAARRFGTMMRRRIGREPVAYILGRKGFRRIELAVDARALIPRPETELLVELALELESRTVLDVGTGSGAIALAVADELPGTELWATDTSAGALDLARANAARLGLEERVHFELGTIPDRAVGDEPFDLVLANLPYVTEAEYATLEPEIRRFEPREALVGGPDGLDPIRALIEALAPAPRVLALEHGERQGDDVRHLLAGAGFTGIETRPDLAGIERISIGRTRS